MSVSCYQKGKYIVESDNYNTTKIIILNLLLLEMHESKLCKILFSEHVAQIPSDYHVNRQDV